MLAVLRAALRSERRAFLELVVALSLGVLAVRLGESRGLWWYVLGAPPAWFALREIPHSIAERRARRRERARVKAIAEERGHARHVRRGDR